MRRIEEFPIFYRKTGAEMCESLVMRDGRYDWGEDFRREQIVVTKNKIERLANICVGGCEEIGFSLWREFIKNY